VRSVEIQQALAGGGVIGAFRQDFTPLRFGIGRAA
jgi:hypothetical protein